MRRKLKVYMLAMVLAFTMVMNIVGAVPVQGATTVVIDPNTRYQAFEGWGTSLCWWGNVVGNYPDTQRKAIENLIFNQSTGLGFNIARYNIGGGENPAHQHMRAGGEMEGFQPSAGTWNWNADAGQRRVLSEIVPMGVNIVEAFSNSPPYWMTNSGCASGAATASNNNLKDDMYDDFAEYLTEVVKHFRDSWGITFRTLDPLNEPNTNYWGANGGQEGCHFDPAKQNQIIKEVGSRLASKGLTGTKVSAPDESVLETCITDYNAYDSTARSYIAQINAHTYGGSNRTGVRDLAKAQGKRLWMSEVDGNSGSHDHNAMAPALWLAGRISLDLRELQPAAWVIWQAVENEQNMLPGRENQNWGLIHSDFENGGSNYYITKKYYAMGNYSKYIRPGYTFIYAGNSKTVAAVDSANGKLVIVSYNDTSSGVSNAYDMTRFGTVAASATVYTTSSSGNLVQSSASIANKVLNVTVPANSVVTYVVNASGTSGTPVSTYRIVNRNSGKVLDVSGGSTADGGDVIQWTNNGGTNQQWTLIDAGSSYSRIMNVKSGKVLDVSGASTADGGDVVQWTDNGGTNQQWQIVDVGSGYSRIVNRNSGKVLDVSGASTADGGNVVQWTSNGGTNQQWQLVKLQ